MSDAPAQPDIQAQAAAVVRAAMNLRAHIHTIEDLIRQKRRTEAELILSRSFLLDLEAAAKTLGWLEKNEHEIKSALARHRG
tara:strand:- start:401 stop:646 length:246 start_codon:yes stop_codon:yes gene_type:complete